MILTFGASISMPGVPNLLNLMYPCKAMVTLLLYNSGSLHNVFFFFFFMMGLAPAFFVAGHTTKVNTSPDESWGKTYER